MASQRWVVLDVDYFANPKILAAGSPARELHLASICWVGRYLTDGFIANSAVEDIAHAARVTPRQTRDTVSRLVTNRLWIPSGDGYVLHDFTTMNGTRAEYEKSREKWRERQARYRAKQLGGSDVTP
jgi:hypothetical protein